MKMILSGGGTAGHIYPGLAVANELGLRGVDLSYIGTADGPEARLVPEAGIDFLTVDAAGFDRSRLTTLFTSSVRDLFSALRVRQILRKRRPDAVICFGGYVSIPVGLAARWAGIPLMLHEQNSVMGMTNRFLSKYAAQIFLTYPQTLGIPDRLRVADQADTSQQIKVSGNPVRQSILEADPQRGRKAFGVPDAALLLVVFGGSRGARHINQALLRVAPQLLQDISDLHIVHAAGIAEYDDALSLLDQILPVGESRRERYHLLPYLEQMGDALAAADLALTRAGATSIAELTALGVPSVLVPFPYATDDHQTKNAAALTALGGARLIADAQLDDAIFETSLSEILRDGELRATMAKQAKALGRPDAAVRLADEICARVTL